MPTQSDFPGVWSADCDAKRVKVEIRVANAGADDFQLFGFPPIDNPFTEDYEWIEIPTSSVETYVTKGEAAAVQRAAKVRFPTEWGRNSPTVTHNSPRNLIESYDPEESNPFSMARVAYKRRDDEWTYVHVGWVGGLGPAAREGESKLWIYDFAELLTGVPVTVTFNGTQVRTALKQIGNVTANQTPVPLSGAILMNPETEEEFKQVAAEADLTDFEGAIPTRGIAEGNAPLLGITDEDVLEFMLERDSFDTLVLGPEQDGVLPTFTKTFQKNHDTLLDVYSWFEDRTAAKLHFEPAADGDSVALVADVVPERRIFKQDQVIEQEAQSAGAVAEATEAIGETLGLPVNVDSETFGEFHFPVQVTKNNALMEIKPKNTLHLRGETASGFFGQETFNDSYAELSQSQPASKQFPVVKVQVPPLVEAAGGAELAPEVIESDAKSLDEAESQATTEMREILSEMTEGEIILRGSPHLLPYDRVEAYEVCNGTVEINQEPVTYEVEEVKHTQIAGEFYETRVRVSLWANDENIEVVESRMVAMDESPPPEQRTATDVLDLFGLTSE